MDAAYRTTASSGEPRFNMRDAAHSPLPNRTSFPHPLVQFCTALEVTSTSTAGPAHRRALITLPTASEHGPPLRLPHTDVFQHSCQEVKLYKRFERPALPKLTLILLRGGNAPSEWVSPEPGTHQEGSAAFGVKREQ